MVNRKQLTIVLAMLGIAGCDVADSPDPAELAQQAQACAAEEAALVDGTGTYTRAINSESAAAQAFFAQGLQLTYGYYFPEALASFDAALCFDRDNPMIQWGRALAIAPNPNSRYVGATDDPRGVGREAIQLAQQLALQHPDQLTPADQALIDSLAALYGTAGDAAARTAAFIEASQTAYAQHPDDPDVAFVAAHAIMLATPWQYFHPQQGHAINRAGEAQQILETALAQTPDHPGLNHIYIHLMENSPVPGRAEAVADRLESLAPKAGHMVHMPGHIYMRLGRYDDAIATNERSLAADNDFLEQWGDRPFPRGITTLGLSAQGHAGHARSFIHWAALMQGNSARALSQAKATADNITVAEASRGGARAIAAYWLTLRVFNQWDAIAEIPQPPESVPFLQGIWQFVQGSAYAAQADYVGNLEQAEQALAALDRLRQRPELAEQQVVVNPADEVLTVAYQLLAGDIARAQDEHAQAIAAYQQAVAVQDQLNYIEPPDWLYSSRWSLGRAYLDAGDYAEAREVFLQDLEDWQNNGWALHGLWQSLRGLDEPEEVEKAAEAFGRAWRWADVDMGEIVF